jgi:hypothetical protein
VSLPPYICALIHLRIPACRGLISECCKCSLVNLCKTPRLYGIAAQNSLKSQLKTSLTFC